MDVLVLNLSNIGDVILTTGVLEGLKRKYPHCKIDLLLGERASEIFLKDPRLRQTIVYNKKASLLEKLKLLRSLKRKKYDLVVDLRQTFISYILGKRVLRSSRLQGHRYLKHNSCLKKFFPLRELKEFKPKIYWSKQEESYLDSLGFQDYIAISPLARSSSKSWPLQNFRKLLKLLRERYPNLVILLLGDQEQYQECETLKLDSQIINLASRTNLVELACLVSKARMVISNDSAVLHIASAVGTPTLAIFGPTSELKYGPLAESSLVLRRHYPCSPCEKAQCVYGDKRCLKSITPEEVLEFASKIMKGEKIVLREEYPRILLTRVDKIGDLILTTPAIQAVRKNFPHSFICFLCDKRTQEIIASNPYLDEVLSLDKSGRAKGMRNFFKLLNLIRKRKFELVINFHPSKRVHLLSFLARIPYRIGYNRKMGWLNNLRVRHAKQLGEKSELEYNFDLLRKIGIEEVLFRQTLIPQASALEWAEQELEKKSIAEFVAIHPGASCPSKIWPLENFLSLSKRIIEETNFKVIFLLGPQEADMESEIRKLLKEDAVIYSNLDLRLLIALISKASLMISNDSGPMHIADALCKPVIAIFGRNQPGLSFTRWGPVGKDAVVIHKEVGCEKCLAHNCQKNFLCLREITSEEVYAKFEEVLELIK